MSEIPEFHFLPFDAENHQPGGRRVQIVCTNGHELFVIAEYFADGEIWRSDGYAVDDEPMGGWFRTQRTYRVLRNEVVTYPIDLVDADEDDYRIRRRDGMDDEYGSGQFGQYRFACERCKFNALRTDDASDVIIPLSQGPSVSERRGKASRELFAVFDRLVDNWPGPGVAKIEGRRLVQIAWGQP